MSDTTFRINKVRRLGSFTQEGNNGTYRCSYTLTYNNVSAMNTNVYVVATDALDAFQEARKQLQEQGYVEAEGEP